MKYKKEFKKENPETIGETDYTFDISNYCDWLEEKYEELKIQRDVAVESLEECDFSICRLCKVINPHHKDCTQCDDRDDLLKALSKLKGGIE